MKNLIFALGFLLLALPGWAGPKCRTLFGEARLHADVFPERISEHVIRADGREFLPLINSLGLVNYVERGGRPKSGIAPVWSSREVLEQVLSLNGPLGNWGPLSPLFGVLGRGPLYPSYWINDYFRIMQANHYARAWLDAMRRWGPIEGPIGPLKEFGPLYGNGRESVYSSLGTAGFLGPLVLGPLGPLGGLQTAGLRGPDSNGIYHDRKTGQVVDSIQLTSGGQTREYRIFKVLDPQYAFERSQQWSLDTSFAVDGAVARGANLMSYRITNPSEQMISILVIPKFSRNENNQPLNFDLSVTSESGRLLLDSKQTRLVNFVQLKVERGARLLINVTRQDSKSKEQQKFRLIVVGAPYFDLQAEGVLETPRALPMP